MNKLKIHRSNDILCGWWKNKQIIINAGRRLLTICTCDQNLLNWTEYNRSVVILCLPLLLWMVLDHEKKNIFFSFVYFYHKNAPDMYATPKTLVHAQSSNLECILRHNMYFHGILNVQRAYIVIECSTVQCWSAKAKHFILNAINFTRL